MGKLKKRNYKVSDADDSETWDLPANPAIEKASPVGEEIGTKSRMLHLRNRLDKFVDEHLPKGARKRAYFK